MIMVVVSLACTVLAAWLAVPPTAGRRLETRLSPVRSHVRQESRAIAEHRRRRRRSWRHILSVIILLILMIIAVSYLAGARTAVVAGACLLVAATANRLITQYRRRRSTLRARADVAHACTVLASYLRVGQVPAAALAIAAADCEVLRDSHRAGTLGGDVVEVWRQQARRAGHSGLLQLARAWQVSSETGAPMSTTLDQVAASLAADQALTRVVNGELAAARATSKVMAVLPACGIGIGYLLGGDPARWLLSAPAGWACLLSGVLLACAGVLWIEALARHASGEA
jgi:tight adherence protein B